MKTFCCCQPFPFPVCLIYQLPLLIFSLNRRLLSLSRQGMCFGVVQLGVVMFCFSKYFLHRFFFLSFFSIQLLFFTALERSLVGYWAISQHGPSGLRHSATFPNFDGLINWSSNDIGMRSMEVWNWEHKISNNLLITSHNCFFKFSFLGL